MDHSTITIKTLTSFGLTPTEATLYVAGLSLASCTPQTLAQKTHIKRPTVYHALETLKEKGLVTEHKAGTKTHFTMAHPEQVRSLFETKKAELDTQAKTLDTIIPFLTSLQTEPDKAQVVHHFGMEGVKLVMDAAFRAKSKHWDILAPYHNFLREEKDYAQQYLKTRDVRGITARTLWELKRGERTLTKEEQRIRNPRILPPALVGKFDSMIILFDDKVAIFSSHKNLSAIMITSKETHALFQAMFDGLWELSTPY